MNEKELLSQLNNFKNIKPDNNWKQESRDVLLSQISAGDCGREESVKFNIAYYFRNFFHQPVLVVSAILLIVLGGGIFSVGASRGTKPGDSLYIAKIISEKAQLAITFNEKDKAKLGIEFAGNRAKEIAQVLADESNNDKQVKVKQLAQNFKKEISEAKVRLKNINVIKSDDSVKSGNESGQEEVQKQIEDNQVFSANLGKDDKGMEIYDPKKTNKTEQEQYNAITVNTASTSPKSVKSALDEAEELFAKKDYGGASDKLDEANAMIDEPNNKTVKSEDSATTTEDIGTSAASEETGGEAATSTEE